MRAVRWMAVAAVSGILAGGVGCQPWQKKYETCVQEKTNLESLFEGTQQQLQQCTAERDRLAAEASGKQPVRAGGAAASGGGLEAVGGVYDAAKGTVTVTLGSDVLFDSGKVVLKTDSKAKLDRIAGIVRGQYAGKDIWVVGHTDSDPIRKSKWSDNLELSSQRAMAVTRYLIQQGIPAKQLVAAGRGEHHALGSDKAKNRRVEIVVYTR